MTASNELIDNWDASAAIIPTLLREAVTTAEDDDFYVGDGVNRALGILNSGAVINYNRAAASSISFADVTGMFARSWMRGGSKVWVASQTTIPQLVTIADGGSNSIWVNSVVPGLPPTLYGIPVLFYELSPVLGNRGDLTLIDFSFYLIKDGSGPFVALSEHFRFQNNEVAFRIIWHVDGQSWLDEAIPLQGKDSTTDTVSPYVVLDTP
jgi:HK97 family phage major capsid protein